MSEPLRASQHQEPRPDLAPYEQAAGDSDHADHPARTRAWFHRTAPGMSNSDIRMLFKLGRAAP